jgi:hypothetical protein
MRTALVLIGTAAAAAALAAQEAGRLGGGYRDAKWGLDPEQVRPLIQGKPGALQTAPDGDTSLAFQLEGGRKLTLWFYRQRLYSAVYQPLPKDGDEQGARALLAALRRKYGEGSVRSGYVDTRGAPLLIVAWDDGTTEIQNQMRQPPAAVKPAAYPSASVKVVYRSISLTAERERDPGPGSPSRDQLQQRAATFDDEI